MGGREGGRGYLYQSVVSVLQSFKDKEWRFVQVEPDTANDKVDILWEYEAGTQKVAQVKSSFNNFSKTDIIHWVEEITNDASNANEITLILIGSLSDNTKKFINKLNKIDPLDANEMDELQGLKDDLHKISVHQENFELTALESKINNSIDLFLTEQGHTVGYYTRTMMVDALVNTFNKFSIQGRKVSRDEFEQNLLDWVYFNFPDVRGSDLVKKSLVVNFYLSKVINFSKQAKGLKYNFEKISFLERKKQELIDWAHKIDNIKLPKRSEEVSNEENETFKNLSRMIAGFGGTYISSEIPDVRKEKLIERIKQGLDITLTENFFYVGELQEQQVGVYYPLGGGPVKGIKGSEIEKEKGALIDTFLDKLDEFEGMKLYLKYLSEFHFIPLVLKNEGLSYDEDIKVRILIPKNVLVLTSDNIVLPNLLIIDHFTGYDSFLDGFLRHHKDSKVMENINDTFYSLNIPLLNNGKKDEGARQDFQSYVRTFFDVEYFEDDDENNLLLYEFDKLNANENISFPSYILVQANGDFTIKYEITSKKLGRVNKGELFYKI